MSARCHLRHQLAEGQTRLGSGAEAIVSVTSGFILALFIWQFIAAPLWGYEITFLDNLGLTSIFTVAGVIRSYIWRRIFERKTRR